MRQASKGGIQLHFADNDTGGNGGKRLATGLAVSVLAHSLLLVADRLHRPVREMAPDDRHRPLSVWIQPPPPPVVTAAAPTRRLAPTARPRPARSRRIIAIEPQPAALPDPATVVVAPAEPNLRFDMETARLAARGMAGEPVLTAQGRVKERRIASETKLARDIDRAERRDCKDGIPGGLLAPLYLLMEKKDHGCKW